MVLWELKELHLLLPGAQEGPPEEGPAGLVWGHLGLVARGEMAPELLQGAPCRGRGRPAVLDLVHIQSISVACAVVVEKQKAKLTNQM